MEIYITRHGQTSLNAAGIIQGSGIDEPLNEIGMEQAKRFYDHYQHIAFDAVYCSELKRTYQTLQMWEQNGYTVEPMQAWNEINWGVIEGKEPSTEVQNIFNYYTRQWKLGNTNLALQGGESPQQMQQRQLIGLQYLLQNHEQHRVLICMHGRAMRSFLCLLTGQPLANMDTFAHTNTSLYVLRKQPHTNLFDILENNQTKHLNATGY